MGETVKMIRPRVTSDDNETTEPACDGTGTIGMFDCRGCAACAEESEDEDDR